MKNTVLALASALAALTLSNCGPVATPQTGSAAGASSGDAFGRASGSGPAPVQYPGY